MKKTLFIFSIILLFIFGNHLILEKNAVGALIDFEAGPANPNPYDHQPITNQYAPLIYGGVTFSTNVNPFYAGLEQVGDQDVDENGNPNPNSPGFINDVNFFSNTSPYEDTEAAGFAGQLGAYYLRLNTGDLLDFDPPVLSIDYTVPAYEVSAEIWDIDATSNLGNEQWRVLAYDGTGKEIGRLDSPVGLVYTEPGSLDAKPWKWEFSGIGNIQSIDIVFMGTKDEGIGLAFDNFYSNPVPIPGAIWLFGSGILGMVFMRRKRKN